MSKSKTLEGLAMKWILSIAIPILLFVSPNANAWFFFFFPIPGSRGAPGDTCVTQNAKVGDSWRSPNGGVATIKEVSGTSSRCRKPEIPILAKVEYVAPASFTSKAGISLPDGFVPQSLTELQQFNGALVMAKDNGNDAGVFVTTTKRDIISDMTTYVINLRANQAKNLDDAKQTDTEQLMINGLKAWRFETAGKLKNLFGSRYTYLMTVLEGANEVVAINTWTNTGNYDKQKGNLIQLASKVTGLEPPPVPAEKPKEPANTVVAVPPVADIPVAPVASSPPASTVEDRLRELNRLYKEGLISKKEFEAKKSEILKAM